MNMEAQATAGAAKNEGEEKQVSFEANAARAAAIQQEIAEAAASGDFAKIGELSVEGQQLKSANETVVDADFEAAKVENAERDAEKSRAEAEAAKVAAEAAAEQARFAQEAAEKAAADQSAAEKLAEEIKSGVKVEEVNEIPEVAALSAEEQALNASRAEYEDGLKKEADRVKPSDFFRTDEQRMTAEDYIRRDAESENFQRRQQEEEFERYNSLADKMNGSRNPIKRLFKMGEVTGMDLMMEDAKKMNETSSEAYEKKDESGRTSYTTDRYDQQLRNEDQQRNEQEAILRNDGRSFPDKVLGRNKLTAVDIAHEEALKMNKTVDFRRAGEGLKNGNLDFDRALYEAKINDYKLRNLPGYEKGVAYRSLLGSSIESLKSKGYKPAGIEHAIDKFFGILPDFVRNDDEAMSMIYDEAVKGGYPESGIPRKYRDMKESRWL